ncbi:SEC-C metal-binding domain-containing protein [Marinobacter sp. TBZ242]|uniref:SEC-C metal-binding domain-containing protein n=1 Tax=Marinobacter azerbaijanicus TaxID=3050455 RepID=A0ABT7IK92_9GAMM|nr:PBPRA1643 family SWIM/SEC-C metal-binding motif protein [Marinobacter sp. TBZ242]MDL0433563.1 SEC-C metal-binding domain-containing protein [Marinobacter sp. TBZ242]
MSDKFFFKGRQDARQHHTAYGGFKTNANQKSGSRKFPLTLVVTSESRKQEIEAQVARAKLHANITVDTRDGAVESIAELTVLQNKGATVTTDKAPSRNDPCSCGSGLKFKKCCG